ncbi:MAG: lytic transglycosylase domain-containing protein [Elusimicrobia bacterium]|nr:lytic transglycosylase domain-containing protein [Elusimicrobiota bacterium]
MPPDAQSLSQRGAGRPVLFAQLRTAVSGAMGWSQCQSFFDAAAARRPDLPTPSVIGAGRAVRPALGRAAVLPAPAKRLAREVPPVRRIVRYDGIVAKYAARYGLDPRLIKSVIAAESSFRRNAVSKAGALGLMQLMPATAEEMGVPRALLVDPEHNIRAGAAYLAHLFKRLFKRLGLAGRDYRRAPRWMVAKVLAAYNAGPRFLTRTTVYKVTRAYIAKVIAYYSSLY